MAPWPVQQREVPLLNRVRHSASPVCRPERFSCVSPRSDTSPDDGTETAAPRIPSARAKPEGARDHGHISATQDRIHVAIISGSANSTLLDHPPRGTSRRAVIVVTIQERCCHWEGDVTSDYAKPHAPEAVTSSVRRSGRQPDLCRAESVGPKPRSDSIVESRPGSTNGGAKAYLLAT